MAYQRRASATDDEFRATSAATPTPGKETQVQRIAAHGVQGAGGAMPFADTIAASFGAAHEGTVRSIQAHTGGAASAAAAAIGAKAYATGNAVAFAGTPDLHTAAHEAAHVVQQRQGVHRKSGDVGDPYERHADAVADRVVAGLSAASLLGEPGGEIATPIVQRKPEDKGLSPSEREAAGYDQYDEQWRAAHGADATGGTAIAGGHAPEVVGGKRRGEAGYGAELSIGAAHRASDKIGKGTYALAEPVAADTAMLDWAMDAQARFIEKHDGPDEHPVWAYKKKITSLGMAKANLAMLERHTFEQWNWVNSYNSWVPFANAARGAHIELIEAAGMMGYDLNRLDERVRFVKEIERGLSEANDLVDAKVLGKHGDTSWAGREADKGALGPGPELKGQAITPLMDTLQASYNQVTVTQMGVYQALEEAKIKMLRGEEQKDKDKLDEINAVIAAWTNAASFVDAAMPMAGKLVGGEYAAKAQAFASSQHAQHVQASNWKGAVALAQEGKSAAQQRLYLERINASQDFNAPPPGAEAGGGFTPSISGVVGALAKLAFKGDIEKLQHHIARLEGQIQSKEAVAQLISTRAKMDAYAVAVEALSNAAKNVQQATLANREAQYLDAGDSLDRYARAHAAQLQARGRGDLVPKDDKSEMFSTLMVLVAKVRAYQMLADASRGMFKYDEFIPEVTKQRDERQSPWMSPELKSVGSDDYFWAPPDIPHTTKKEAAVYEAIDSTYGAVLGMSEKGHIEYQRIEELVTALLQKMKGVKSRTSDVAENAY
jgi:hypothetical protein